MLITLRILIFGIAALASACGVASSSSPSVDLKTLAPASEQSAATGRIEQTAVFAGGCFWGVEAVFERLKGVREARSGYAGGSAKTANYDDVSSGKTDHAEAVIVVYDPSKVSYSQLLAVFFSVAHDPTQLDRQGPDIGRQYRSAIFYNDAEQKRIAEEYIASIDRSIALKGKIVTQVVPLVRFFEAEAYHQNYLVRNPRQPYIVQHDLPKLEELKKRFPELYSAGQ